MGTARQELGVTPTLADSLEDLLKPLDQAFRIDLAQICESHHLDDLDDFSKYKVSQPYGPTRDETANLQYAAILLRTADLLHITRDRTPSIVFRVLSPADPLSQIEWAKQMAVRSVRSQIARDREGNADPDLPRSTIEVHAHFTNENGFFGLTSYLDYAEKQLKQSYAWALLAQKKHAAPHQFPWRNIDQNQIETAGFLRQQFEFTFDQPRILDLLTGHTLYNDTGVVLRELLQNAIDAVRLQHSDGSRIPGSKGGRVEVHWRSQERSLTVTDNGTGMNQDIIENHLLKVGASRYQDPTFRDRHPDFTPISRFGIGILTAFMVSDDVEIVTCHPEDTHARRLSLRSVHGRYLIRLLDKNSDPLAQKLSPHGTQVQLRLRPSADFGDLVALARKWVVIPECEVFVHADNDAPRRIGFGSPGDVLDDLIQRPELLFDTVSPSLKLKVIEESRDGVDLAYLVKWSDAFREWSFVSFPRSDSEDDDTFSPFVGVCVEGIRVDFCTPGFPNRQIYAIANARGPTAPKTNVARIGLENTPEAKAMARSCFALYSDHVRREVEELYQSRSFSLGWAVRAARFLAGPLIKASSSSAIASEEIIKIPYFLVEEDGRLRAVSAAELEQVDAFWTIDSTSFAYMERVLEEIPCSASIRAVLGALGGNTVELPERLMLGMQYPKDRFEEKIMRGWEPAEIRVDRSSRRVDVLWNKRSRQSSWLNPEIEWPRTAAEERKGRTFITHRQQERRGFKSVLMIARQEVAIHGIKEEMAVGMSGYIFLLPGNPIANWFRDLEINNEDAGKLGWQMYYFLRRILTRELRGDLVDMFDKAVAREIGSAQRGSIESLIANARKAVEESSWQIFSRHLWTREEESDLSFEAVAAYLDS